MKNTILLISCFLAFGANAQIIKEIPVDDTGKINFNEVVTVENATQDELYLEAKSFFVNSFKSANDVIQLDDKENRLIIGKGNSKISIPAGLGVSVYLRMNYSIKIQCKEARYKYEIYDISYTGDYGTYPAETWFTEKDYYKKNGKARGINEKYKDKTLQEIESIKSLIYSSMNSKASTNDKW